MICDLTIGDYSSSFLYYSSTILRVKLDITGQFEPTRKECMLFCTCLEQGVRSKWHLSCSVHAKEMKLNAPFLFCTDFFFLL